MQEFLNIARLFSMTPWKQKDVNVFLVLDCADTGGVVTKIINQWPQHEVVRLYQGTKDEEDAAIGPHLLKVSRDSHLMQWFLKEGAEYGIILFSKASAEVLGKHLRPFLESILPGDRRKMFRFYDPATFYYFIPSLTLEELRLFMGPACGAACTRPVCTDEGDCLTLEHSVALELYVPPKRELPWFFSDATYLAFNTPARYALAQTLADDFEAMYPKLSRMLKRERIVDFTSHVVERNESLGWPKKEFVVCLMAYTAQLGINFERDPQYTRIAACLSTDKSPGRQVADMSAAMREYNSAVWGKHGKPYFMAFKRYLAMSYADLHAINYIQEVVGHLKRLYPEKAQYVGDKALYSVAQQGIVKAKEWGLSPRPGYALCAGIFFFIGCGCEHDPLRPWIEDYVRREISPGNKTRKIFDISRRLVRLNLKNRVLEPEQQEALATFAMIKPLANLNVAALPYCAPGTTVEHMLRAMHPEMKDGMEISWVDTLLKRTTPEKIRTLPVTAQALLALGYMASETAYVPFEPDISALHTQCAGGRSSRAIEELAGQVRKLAQGAMQDLYNEYGGDIL